MIVQLSLLYFLYCLGSFITGAKLPGYNYFRFKSRVICLAYCLLETTIPCTVCVTTAAYWP